MKTLSEMSADAALETAERFSAALDFAERFTNRFRETENEPAAVREARMLELQFEHIFQPLETDDRFAGRICYGLVGLSPEPVGLGFYCVAPAFEKAAQLYPNQASRIGALLSFWRGRTTQEKIRAAYPDDVAEVLPSDAWTEDSGVAFPLYRMAGTVLDYDKLLALGLDGLEAESAGTQFDYVVPLMRQTIDRYAELAEPEVAEILRAIRHEAPKTFRQAIQLFWLYALHAGTWNYGRMDEFLGDYLDESISDEEALDDLTSLWRLIHAYSNQYNNRIFIGGKGRRNEKTADRFALLAIEATRRVKLNQPQLSMRFYEGQNPELWERALDAIGEGCTFPMLYNDDVNIPAVASSFGVSEQVAESYTPYGCGEYVLSHCSTGSPNGVINLLKAVEVALHGGTDPLTGRRMVALPAPEELTSFEDVWDAYSKVIQMHVEALAFQQKMEYEMTAEEAPFGFISLLMDDCIARDRSAFGGGARYSGGTLETYGNTNAADSLHVIDELVFRRKEVSLPELVEAMDADFNGYEALLTNCRAVSKYGNDEGVSDAMAQRVHNHICNTTRSQAERVGLDTYLVVIINNWANTVLGWKTAASAEGRLAGQPMANGNNPAPGADVSGPTAFLNSLVQLHPSIHAGSVQNMKFTREWFTPPRRPTFDAMLKTYFAKGGTQAMITVVSREDLESAMKDPPKWGHLLVRVGGFSIRFVDLPHDAQLEVLHRTLN